MMRKMGSEPWVVHSSTDVSEAQLRVVMDGMRCLLDAEAMGKVRRCSIITIEDCTTTLALLENVNDKAKLILELFRVEDDSSYLGKPDTHENRVRKRTQTDHFRFPPSKPKRVCVRTVASSEDARDARDGSSASVSLPPPRPDASDDAIREMETETETELVVWQDDAHESLSAIQAVCRSILSALR